ncbi:MAG: hypothetical protein HOH74_13730, partial [Gemmatimonadetes bacterium]|nr:hypothetical protein [Gemmatimonadota bacterium]
MTVAPALDSVARKTAQSPPFKQVLERIDGGDRDILVHGMPATLGAFLLTAIQRQCNRQIVVVAADESHAESWRDDLTAIAGDSVVHYFPAWDVGIYDGRSPDSDVSGLRIEAVARLASEEPAIVVAPASALLTPVIPRAVLDHATLHLAAGEERSLGDLISHLVDAGFERVPTIDGVGQFSSRGGILDIYPVGVEHPVRLEFFGDEIESIRTFDVMTQRSVTNIGKTDVLPAREVVLHRPFFDDYVPNLERVEQETGVDLTSVKDPFELGTSALEGVEMVMRILYGTDDGLFSYLRDDVLLYSEESEDLDAELDKAMAPSRRDWERHADRGTHVPLTELVRDGAWLHERLDTRPRLRPAPLGQVETAVRFGATEPRIVQGELAVLKQEIGRLDEQS